MSLDARKPVGRYTAKHEHEALGATSKGWREGARKQQRLRVLGALCAAPKKGVNLKDKMKIGIVDLVRVAGLVVKPLDSGRLENAIRSSIGARAKATTVGSTASETKKAGIEFVQSLSLRTLKGAGADARAIHWLAMAAEANKCGWAVPSLSTGSDEAVWLKKFQAQVTPPEDKK